MLWSNEYETFGGLSSSFNTFKHANKYTGKDFDEDTGLYYFNARWYDPELGRFISEDPIKDGVSWYVYCGNNPLVFVDPTGLFDIRWDLGNGIIYDTGTGYINNYSDRYTYDNPNLIDVNLPNPYHPSNIDFSKPFELDLYYGLITLVEGEGTKINLHKNVAKAIFIGIDFVPIVGDVKGVVESIYGKDAFGNDLATYERVLGILCLAELKSFKYADEVVGFVGKYLDEGIDVAGDLSKTVDLSLYKNYDYGKLLKKSIGNPPVDMVNPHAHHILFKKGLGEAQQLLVNNG